MQRLYFGSINRIELESSLSLYILFRNFNRLFLPSVFYF